MTVYASLVLYLSAGTCAIFNAKVLSENPGNNIPKNNFDMSNTINNNGEHRPYFQATKKWQKEDKKHMDITWSQRKSEGFWKVIPEKEPYFFPVKSGFKLINREPYYVWFPSNTVWLIEVLSSCIRNENICTLILGSNINWQILGNSLNYRLSYVDSQIFLI